jgi:hypothetical protein
MESAQSDLEEGGSDGWKQTGQSRKSSSMLTSMVAVLFLRFTKALLGGEPGVTILFFFVRMVARFN